MPAAREIQQAREAVDLANHRERLQWLTPGQPRWACGTLVDTHTRNVLLKQSRAAVAAAAHPNTGASDHE